jgi:hypothetical protein
VTWAKFEKTDINDPVFFSEQMEINGKFDFSDIFENFKTFKFVLICPRCHSFFIYKMISEFFFFFLIKKEIELIISNYVIIEKFISILLFKAFSLSYLNFEYAELDQS